MKRVTYKFLSNYIKENNLPYELQGYYEKWTLHELDEKSKVKRSVYECVNENLGTIYNWIKNNSY